MNASTFHIHMYMYLPDMYYHFSPGPVASRENAHFGCYADHVHLPSTSTAVWFSGHVVNLPQDVASFARTLPRLPSELDVIVVRKEGANQSHRDFHVRRNVVHRALQWLISNNTYYCANQLRIDQEALSYHKMAISHTLCL